MNAILALNQAAKIGMLARPLSWRQYHCGIAWTGRPGDVVGWTVEFDEHASDEIAPLSRTRGSGATLPPVAELLEEWEVVPQKPRAHV